jgi:hypothetical protein
MTEEKCMTETSTSEVFELAQRWVKSARFWYFMNWNILQHSTWLGLLCCIIVPFGLAALLYIDDKNTSRALNITLMIISALAFGLQAVVHFLRLPERTQILKQIWTEGEIVIAQFRDGLIQQEGLCAFLERQKELWNQEHI